MSFTKVHGGDQTVSMEYDNPDSGVSFDKSSYSRNTVVEATIDDMALNVDPTSDDIWYFDSVGGQAIYAGAELTTTQIETITAVANTVQAGTTETTDATLIAARLAVTNAQTILTPLQQPVTDTETALDTAKDCE